MKRRLALAPALCALAGLVIATGGMSNTDRKRPRAPKITGITTSNDLRLSFAARDNVTPARALRYRCSVDGGRYVKCRSAASLRLAVGTHTLRVIAVDRAGNKSRPSAARVNVTATPTFTRVPIGGGFSPGELIAGGDALWLGGSDGIRRIDPATNAISMHSPGQDLAFLSFGHGSLWTTSFDPGAVIRIDPATGLRTAIATPFPAGVAADAESVWVTGRRDGTISRIDPLTNAKANTYRVGPEGDGGPGYIVPADDGLWVGSSFTDPRLVRVAPTTGAVTVRANSGQCSDLVVVGDVVLHTCSRSTYVALVARSTGITRRVVTSCGSEQPLVVGTAVWVPCNSSSKPPRLFRIDLARARVVEEIVLPEIREVSDGTVGFGSAWLVVPGEAVLRLPISALSR